MSLQEVTIKASECLAKSTNQIYGQVKKQCKISPGFQLNVDGNAEKLLENLLTESEAEVKAYVFFLFC